MYLSSIILLTVSLYARQGGIYLGRGSGEGAESESVNWTFSGLNFVSCENMQSNIESLYWGGIHLVFCLHIT